MATHASALKAHRQSLVHRERNRKYRSQLRSTLKEIRSVIDSKDQAAARKQLGAAISLIDKMAGKGIIHRNTASRYKSRLSARLSKKERFQFDAQTEVLMELASPLVAPHHNAPEPADPHEELGADPDGTGAPQDEPAPDTTADPAAADTDEEDPNDG